MAASSVIGLISSSARWINILDFHSLRHDASEYLEIILRAFRAYLFDNPFAVRLALKCPLWVISGHADKSAPCPLYPQ